MTHRPIIIIMASNLCNDVILYCLLIFEGGKTAINESPGNKN